MSYVSGNAPPFTVTAGPPAGAFAGVRTRRIFAFLVDLIVVSMIFVALFVALSLLGVVTLGLAWLLIPPMFAGFGLIAILYNGISISGWRMATPGMRVMDLEMRMMDGTRVPFINAAVHVILFYLSWTILTPLVLLVSLFTRDKRCLHDMAAGIVVTRRI